MRDAIPRPPEVMFVAFLWIGSPIQWSLCGSIAGLRICMFWLKKQMALLLFLLHMWTCEENQTKKTKTKTFFLRHKVALFVLDFLCSRSFWFSIAHGGRSFYTLQCWRANGVCTRLQRKLLVSKVLFSQAFLRKECAKIIDLSRWWEGLVDKGKIHTSKIPNSKNSNIATGWKTWPQHGQLSTPTRGVDQWWRSNANQHFPAIEVPNAMSSNHNSFPVPLFYDMGSLSKMRSQRIR